jgi:hypothetical protein
VATHGASKGSKHGQDSRPGLLLIALTLQAVTDRCLGLNRPWRVAHGGTCPGVT